ncbi:hypothetical protein THAOC_09873 [Thalassiosira oceanica]|uniref:peptidylprolyl isomerase n=1 Tax=Thalassiosira oceanica TaxID=159749 RepID=K0SVC1_THAOC|nr:hypothetical protein THAOC_09873 [Thalassiosira oceanica]|eukprot:EJK68909.1 hypothetical protein THAOC_09873 [Thalassiosira oceanica]
MGRRRRGDNYKSDDDFDSVERAWLHKRQKTEARHKSERPAAEGNHANNEEQHRTAREDSSKVAPAESNQIDRLKDKKQKQKEARKRKKAARLEAEEALKQQRKAEDDARKARAKSEQEKKRNIRDNAKASGFKVLAKGVRSQDLIVGKGKMVEDRKKVRVSYVLRSKSHTTGKIIDSSHNFGFRLGRGEVIRGWDIGLEGMRVGGTRRLVVPPEAGYGRSKDVGAGKGAELFFQIELLSA